MALRKAVWTDQEDKSIQRSPNEGFTHMLDDLVRFGWDERDLEFDLESPQSIARLKKALARFAHEVDNTYGGLSVAFQQEDVWHERQLGPSARGKMASDYFWHLYFRKEGRAWKIWKMELAIH